MIAEAHLVEVALDVVPQTELLVAEVAFVTAVEWVEHNWIADLLLWVSCMFNIRAFDVVDNGFFCVACRRVSVSLLSREFALKLI